jgi:CHC2 zinc finger/Toprim domain
MSGSAYTTEVDFDRRRDDARLVKIEDAVERLQITGLRRQSAELVGPCPRCGGTDRFAVNVHKQVFNCRGCQTGGDVISLVRHVKGCSFADAIDFLVGAPLRGNQHPEGGLHLHRNDERDRHADNSMTARWLWAKRRPITPGSPPYLYLCNRLRVKELRYIPATLGYLPARGGYSDSMIAAFGCASEMEPGVLAPPKVITGVHITRITAEGEKAPDPNDKAKIMLGPSMGQPIVLSPPNDLFGMAAVEGIETGLSVYAGTGLGVWVAGSAGRLPALAHIVPAYIEVVTIYQEPDRAGVKYATELAQALSARGIEVRISEAPL